MRRAASTGRSATPAPRSSDQIERMACRNRHGIPAAVPARPHVKPAGSAVVRQRRRTRRPTPDEAGSSPSRHSPLVGFRTRRPSRADTRCPAPALGGRGRSRSAMSSLRVAPREPWPTGPAARLGRLVRVAGTGVRAVGDDWLGARSRSSQGGAAVTLINQRRGSYRSMQPRPAQIRASPVPRAGRPAGRDRRCARHRCHHPIVGALRRFLGDSPGVRGSRLLSRNIDKRRPVCRLLLSLVLGRARG